jgi:hypothetical protein
LENNLWIPDQVGNDKEKKGIPVKPESLFIFIVVRLFYQEVMRLLHNHAGVHLEALAGDIPGDIRG